MACHTPPLKKAKKQGNAITQSRSHPIKKMLNSHSVCEVAQ